MRSKTVNRATLHHTTIKAKLRETIKTALDRAQSDPSGIVVVDVYSRRNKHFLSVCGTRNNGYRVCDTEGIDVTDLVKRTLGHEDNQNEQA